MDMTKTAHHFLSSAAFLLAILSASTSLSMEARVPSMEMHIAVRNYGIRVVAAELQAAAIHYRMTCSEEPPAQINPQWHTSLSLSCQKDDVGYLTAVAYGDSPDKIYIMVYYMGKERPVLIANVIQRFMGAIFQDPDIGDIKTCEYLNNRLTCR